MKNVLAAFLLLMSLNAFAADEGMVVTGSRLPPESGPGLLGGGGGKGGPLDRKRPCKVRGCGNPAIGEPTGPSCAARTVVINKPHPLCGSFGETPAFLRGDVQQIYLTCPGKEEYLWKETLLGCKDPT
jgi:hypothetical protein